MAAILMRTDADWINALLIILSIPSSQHQNCELYKCSQTLWCSNNATLLGIFLGILGDNSEYHIPGMLIGTCWEEKTVICAYLSGWKQLSSAYIVAITTAKILFACFSDHLFAFVCYISVVRKAPGGIRS